MLGEPRELRDLEEGLADFPVVAGGIDEAADAPAVVLVGDRPDDFGSGGDGAVEDNVGIVDGENEADGRAAEGFGAEILVLRGFFGDPELGALNGEVSDGRAFIDAEEDSGAEGGLVEVDGASTVADREHGGEVGPTGAESRLGIAHRTFIADVEGYHEVDRVRRVP